MRDLDPYVLMRSCIAKPTISLPTLYTSVISCLQTYGRNSHLSVTERWECFRTFVNTIFSASGRFLSTGALGALSPEAFLGSPRRSVECYVLSSPLLLSPPLLSSPLLPSSPPLPSLFLFLAGPTALGVGSGAVPAGSGHGSITVMYFSFNHRFNHRMVIELALLARYQGIDSLRHVGGGVSVA